MTSIIKLHAISGAMDESPPCYLLQIDDFKFLLDCGWDENFNLEMMKELRRHVNQIDAVLLTYPDNLHLGGLPYLVGKCGLSCPVYATIPVYKMGQMFMYDLYQSRFNTEEFTTFNLDDVDAAFDKVVQLKYNQTVSLRGKVYGLSITPIPAGHMIGGTIWKIMKTGEEDIIYAVDFNHKKERHLNGCDLEKLQRPSLLITDAFNAVYTQARRRARDEKLMTNILQTLSNNGNVLLAVDTAGRVLELAHMLDQLWRNKKSGLQTHPLCLLNNVSYNVVEFAKSQIEWMSEKLMKSFEAVRNNPFQFKHIRICHSVGEVNKIGAAKVVLASMPDLECGFARDLCLQWITDPNNSIVLTSRSSPGTLTRKLIEGTFENKKSIKVLVKKRVRLEGEELAEYIRLHQKDDGPGGDKESSESEDDVQLLSVVRGTHDLVVKTERKSYSKRSRYKGSKKSYPMYPSIDGKSKVDEYGEVVNIENYKIIDTNVSNKTVTIGHLSHEKSKREKEKEKEDSDYEAPTKCIEFEQEFEIAAQIMHIDFEGRSDGESVQKLVTNLRPRRVIIIRGTKTNTESLAKRISQWTDAKVYTPNKGDVIDVTTETHIYQIRLTDALVSSLNIQKGRDVELAWVDSVATARIKSKDTVQEEMEVEKNSDSVTDKSKIVDDLFTLEPVSLSEVNPHESVFINELRLSELKQLLTKNNIESEFAGGVLWCCNRTIAIRRQQGRRVSIEGWISDNYYRVRSILYSQFAIL